QGLSPRLLRADRVQLPASADLLGLCRGGDRPVRSVGRRLDDARAALSLSPVWHPRARFRGVIVARWRALVSALALWPLARHQLRPGDCAAARLRLWRFIASKHGALRALGTSYNRASPRGTAA